MKSLTPLLLLSALVVGCSGGGSSATPQVAVSGPTAAPSATPTQSATAAPTVAPTASPVPLALHVAAAPAQVYTAQGLVRRSAQDVRRIASVNLGSGGVPTVIVGYSATMGGISGQFYTWAATAQATPVPEASLNVTPIGPITIQAVNQDNTNLFAASLFDWIVNPGPLTGTGKIQMAVAFGDGTTGIIPYYSYDKWNLTCAGVLSPGNPNQWGYHNGVPVGFSSNNDVNLDCANNVNFPNGAALLAAPTADAYGNLAAAFTSVLSPTFSNPITTLPLASLQVGAVYLVKTTDGGYMKFMALQNVQPSTGFNASLFGISLHDSPSGSRQFTF